MKISDITPSKKPLVLATAAEVEALESQLWIKFPAGYRQYITQLGEGVLGGNLVRIYPPWRIDKELLEWRRRINKYWFWDKGRAYLPKERALECIIIGDTVNGDELVFHPTQPDKLFVLPHDNESVFLAEDNLLSAIEWICNSGELVEQFTERHFEPFDSRKQSAEREAASDKVIDPDGESLNDLVELGKRWAKRHSARKLSQQGLKRDQAFADAKQTLLFEAIALDGEYPHESVYFVAYRIADKNNGREMGTFTWHMNTDGSGSQFVPKQAVSGK